MHQCGKRIQTKSKKAFEDNSNICGSYRAKLAGGGRFCPPSILNRVNSLRNEILDLTVIIEISN